MRSPVWVLGAALVLSCRWTQAPPLPVGTIEPRVVEANAPELVLGPSDLVRVTVFLHPENSTPESGARIDAEGMLDLPLVGPLSLAGLSVAEARELVAAELAIYLREPRVSIDVIQHASLRFYVLGELEKPGSYPLDRPLTALQALSLAGNFRPGADRRQVALLRPHGRELEVYFFDASTPGTDGLVWVQPDDLLFVRLSGAGTFRDQLLPIVQSIVPPITGLASVIVVADQLNE